MSKDMLPEIIEELLEESECVINEPDGVAADKLAKELAKSAVDKADDLCVPFIKHLFSRTCGSDDLLRRTMIVRNIGEKEPQIEKECDSSSDHELRLLTAIFGTDSNEVREHSIEKSIVQVPKYERNYWKQLISRTAVTAIAEIDSQDIDYTRMIVALYGFSKDVPSEVFDAVLSMADTNDQVHEMLHWLLGELAYLAGKYSDAIEELENVIEGLDSYSIFVLAESYFHTGAYESALQYYTMVLNTLQGYKDIALLLPGTTAIKSDGLQRSEKIDKYSLVLHLGQCLLRFEKWEEARQLMICAAAYNIGSESFLKLGAFATAHVHWMTNADPSLPSKFLNAVYELGQCEPQECPEYKDLPPWLVPDEDGFIQLYDFMIHDSEHTSALLSITIGYAEGLMDIARKKDSELSGLAYDKSKLLQSYLEKDRQLMDERKKTIDVQEYTQTLLSRYPGLPENAARHLAHGIAVCHRPPRGYLPQHIAGPICVGVECVLRDGFFASICEVINSATDNKLNYKSIRKLWPRYEGNRYEVSRLTLGNMYDFISDRGMAEFPAIIDELPKEVQEWLNNKAANQLYKLKDIRNKSAHGERVCIEDVDDLRDLVFGSGGLLEMAIKASGRPCD